VVAHAAWRHGPSFRIALAALSRPPPPFAIDPSRLYEVEEGGQLYVSEPADPARDAALGRRIRIWWISAAALNALLMGSTAAAFAVLGRGVAAGMGLLVVAVVPLLSIAPVLEWRRLRALRRRQSRRPEHFGAPRA
jgi:hypothetical protein